MPEYGEKTYWDERYSSEHVPFDWMCDWKQLEPTIRTLIEEHEQLLSILSSSSSSITKATTTTTTDNNNNNYNNNKRTKNDLDYYDSDNNDNNNDDDANDKKNSQKQQPRILIVGCGNAPFSIDIHHLGGYTNCVNIDYSEVVILQQRAKFPTIDWRVVNALDMTNDFDDDSFDYVIDKSLIDTTMCYPNGHDTTMTLFDEIHRVLKPGGRLMTISLHGEEEVRVYAKIGRGVDFACTTCKIVNLRRREEESSDGEEREQEPTNERTLFHTFAVFDKLDGLTDEEQLIISNRHPLVIVGSAALSSKADGSDAMMVTTTKLKKAASSTTDDKENQWDPRKGLFDEVAAMEDLMDSLDAVLEDFLKIRRIDKNLKMTTLCS